MEENENGKENNIVESEVSSNEKVEEKKVEEKAENEKETSNTNDVSSKKNVTDVLKSKKSLIIKLVIIIVAILIVIDILFTSPKEAVKSYLKNNYAAHTKKADKYYDYAGASVFRTLDKDEREDFWDEYKDYTSSDEWEEYKEELEENHDDEYYEDRDEDIKDSDTKTKLKKINSVKKIGSHLYKVSVEIQTKDEDGEKETDTRKYYVMKKGLKSYVLGFEN